MKANNTRPVSIRLFGLMLCVVALAVSWSIHSPVAYAEGNGMQVPVVASDSDAAEQSGQFLRVVAVPANVDIPDFYQQVINVSGMYIFTMPNGTIHKRIYGALDDVYGWYEPVGQDNIVPAGSIPIDTAKDAEMYYAAVSKAELEAMDRQDFAGILPPEDSVTEVDKLNGVPVDDLVFYCASGVVALCLLITVGALIARAVARRKDELR